MFQLTRLGKLVPIMRLSVSSLSSTHLHFTSKTVKEDKHVPSNPPEVDAPATLLKTPRGTRDRSAGQVRLLRHILNTITECFEHHDALPMETPILEMRDVLSGKYGDEGAKQVFHLATDGTSDESLSLRYDLTVPWARYLATNKVQRHRRYQVGLVYRVDKPNMSAGRLREFYQCDFDIAGDCDAQLGESECLSVIHEVLQRLQLGPYRIRVNHRRLLEALVCEVAQVPRDRFPTVCTWIDKMDRVPWEIISKTLQCSVGLSRETVSLLSRYVSQSGSGTDLVSQLVEDSLLRQFPTAQSALQELATSFKWCAASGLPSDSLVLDLSLARGLHYYTGVIWEAILPEFSVEQTQTPVGSVAGGGRYDELVSAFLPQMRVPCVGVSFGVERLCTVLAALRARKAWSGESQFQTALRPSATQVMVVTAERDATELMEHKLRLVAMLRGAGFKTAYTEKYSPRFLDQMNYCESHGIPLAVVLGRNEVAQEKVKLRRVDTRQETFVNISDLLVSLRSALEDIEKTVQ